MRCSIAQKLRPVRCGVALGITPEPWAATHSIQTHSPIWLDEAASALRRPGARLAELAPVGGAREQAHVLRAHRACAPVQDHCEIHIVVRSQRARLDPAVDLPPSRAPHNSRSVE